MNLIQELKKHDIDLKVDEGNFDFRTKDGRTKSVKKTDLESYLLLCLINYVKI